MEDFRDLLAQFIDQSERTHAAGLGLVRYVQGPKWNDIPRRLRKKIYAAERRGEPFIWAWWLNAPAPIFYRKRVKRMAGK